MGAAAFVSISEGPARSAIAEAPQVSAVCFSGRLQWPSSTATAATRMDAARRTKLCASSLLARPAKPKPNRPPRAGIHASSSNRRCSSFSASFKADSMDMSGNITAKSCAPVRARVSPARTSSFNTATSLLIWTARRASRLKPSNSRASGLSWRSHRASCGYSATTRPCALRSTLVRSVSATGEALSCPADDGCGFANRSVTFTKMRARSPATPANAKLWTSKWSSETPPVRRRRRFSWPTGRVRVLRRLEPGGARYLRSDREPPPIPPGSRPRTRRCR